MQTHPVVSQMGVALLVSGDQPGHGSAEPGEAEAGPQARGEQPSRGYQIRVCRLRRGGGAYPVDYVLGPLPRLASQSASAWSSSEPFFVVTNGTPAIAGTLSKGQEL